MSTSNSGLNILTITPPEEEKKEEVVDEKKTLDVCKDVWICLTETKGDKVLVNPILAREANQDQITRWLQEVCPSLLPQIERLKSLSPRETEQLVSLVSSTHIHLQRGFKNQMDLST